MKSIQQTVKTSDTAYNNAIAELMRLDPDIVFHRNLSDDSSEPLRGVILVGSAGDFKRLTQISQKTRTQSNQ